VWTLRSAAMTKVLAPDSPPVGFDIRDDRLLVATNYATVSKLGDGKVAVRRWIGPNADARFADDHTIAIVDRQGKLWLWDIATSAAREIAHHQRAGDWVVTDGRGSIASWAGPEVIVAEVQRGAERFRWNAPADISAVTFVSDRGRLAIADTRGTIHLLDSGGRREASWQAKGRASRLSVLADGRLVSASPYVVQLWSSSGRLIHAFDHPGALVSSIAIDRAGARLATASRDGTVRIWDLVTYGRLAELPHTSEVEVAFSRDGQLLATIDDAGVVRIWSVALAKVLFEVAAVSNRGLIGFGEHAVVAVSQATIAVIPLR